MNRFKFIKKLWELHNSFELEEMKYFTCNRIKGILIQELGCEYSDKIKVFITDKYWDSCFASSIKSRGGNCIAVGRDHGALRKQALKKFMWYILIHGVKL